MCREMSQYMPNTAVSREMPSIAPGRDAQPAVPVSRSAKAASLPSHLMRPLRCDVPWHRVVRADGSLAKGSRQRVLLEAEGIPFRGERVDMRAARLPD